MRRVKVTNGSVNGPRRRRQTVHVHREIHSFIATFGIGRLLAPFPPPPLMPAGSEPPNAPDRRSRPHGRAAPRDRFPTSSRRIFVIVVERVPLSVRRIAFVLAFVGVAGAQAAFAGEKVSYAANGDIVLQAASAKTHVGKWAVAADRTAAGGKVMRQKNEGAKKIYVAAKHP